MSMLYTISSTTNKSFTKLHEYEKYIQRIACMKVTNMGSAQRLTRNRSFSKLYAHKSKLYLKNCMYEANQYWRSIEAYKK